MREKWVYLQRNTLHRESVGPRRRREALRYGVVGFYGLGDSMG